MVRAGTEHIEERSIAFTDGPYAPADPIVFATGCGSMNGRAEQLVSKAVLILFSS